MSGIFKVGFMFSQNWSTYNPVWDATFEIQGPSLAWYTPTAAFPNAPNTVRYGYVPAAFPPVAWRILTTPTEVTFPPPGLIVPAEGPFPFP